MALTDDERQQILGLAQQGISLTAIARRLGRPKTNLMATYRRYQRAGLIPTARSVKGPPWTARQVNDLLNLIESGYSYEHIARRLKRSVNAIIIKAKRLGVRITTTNATMSARVVANTLGLRCSKIVTRWIRLGWLHARDAGAKRPLWRISWDDLTAFMENPDYWIAWKPECISDLALREWAMEVRSGAERYLTHAEVARHYCVGRDTVGQWIDKGWLRALRYGNRFVPASALATFRPPCHGWQRPPDGWPARFVLIGRTPEAQFYKAAA